MGAWNNEKTLSFIDAVRLRPELWDVEDSSYKDRNSKRDSWNTIAREFKITGEEAYKKFRSLRTYTKNEYRNLHKKGGSKAVTWFAYDAMQFILSRDLSEIAVYSESALHAVQTDQLEPDEEDLPLQFVPPQQIARRPQKLLQNKDTLEATDDCINNSSRKRHNPYFGFAEHIANKLSTYDQYTRTQVEFQISKILYEADMKMLRGGQLLFETPSTYSNVDSPVSINENVTSPEHESTNSNNIKESVSSKISKTTQDTISTDVKDITIKVERRLSE